MQSRDTLTTGKGRRKYLGARHLKHYLFVIYPVTQTKIYDAAGEGVTPITLVLVYGFLILCTGGSESDHRPARSCSRTSLRDCDARETAPSSDSLPLSPSRRCSCVDDGTGSEVRPSCCGSRCCVGCIEATTIRPAAKVCSISGSTARLSDAPIACCLSSSGLAPPPAAAAVQLAGHSWEEAPSTALTVAAVPPAAGQSSDRSGAPANVGPTVAVLLAGHSGAALLRSSRSMISSAPATEFVAAAVVVWSSCLLNVLPHPSLPPLPPSAPAASSEMPSRPPDEATGARGPG